MGVEGGVVQDLEQGASAAMESPILQTPKRTTGTESAGELELMNSAGWKVQPKLARFFSTSPKAADMELVQVQAPSSRWTKVQHKVQHPWNDLAQEVEAEKKALSDPPHEL